MKTKKSPKSTPTTVAANHSQVINKIRSLQSAIVHSMKTDTKKAEAVERRVCGELFLLLFGRKASAAEVEHMLGYSESPRCDKCVSIMRAEFLPDGTAAYSCQCTDLLNSMMTGTL